ncbi:hypothetical protein E5161_12030 [Cohnella pontilimi]|uniref:Uncharacterized protein n=1 Tax=Cohnella pontilimi TaxID=2564100 RepID=A0A4U0FF10_9BACL|nr:DUF5693 family protein [Cohnella pontilimi]TJY41922.1 hypothetical protein E5161_12030 [Cohnella pontilimi]
MPQWVNKLNRKLTVWLWWLVLIGVVAALPVMYARSQTEASADRTALVIDYRDVLQASAAQGNPEPFMTEQLDRLKKAGVNGAIVYESTLEELTWSREAAVYDAQGAAALQGKPPEPGDNNTYVLFLKPEHVSELKPIIQSAFARHGAEVTDWSIEGQQGVVIHMGYADAMMRPMMPNPIEMQKLKDAGLWIVPRVSDRFDTFDAKEMNNWLKTFKQYGVDRVTFDGEAVPGFSISAPGKRQLSGVLQFAQVLNQNGIGIAAFENLKTAQKGVEKLANYVDYNIIRAHSVTDGEMAIIKATELRDRILLAVKDRNIRMVFLNAMPTKDPIKGKVTFPIDTIVTALAGSDKDASDGSGGAVADLHHFGFEIGVPQAFTVHHAPAETVLRALAMLGAIAMVATVAGMFLPSLISLVFVAGVVGGAGLYVLRPTLMVQALALFVAIAAPTAAVILLVRRLRATRGESLGVGRRLGSAVLLYIRTAILSMAAIPMVVAMLNHISYSYVLQQFRGVSLLHLGPIALVAAYVFLYGSGNTVTENARNILRMPLTVVWVVGFVVLAGAGYYYLTRTGNAGNVSSVELAFRSILENTFGVRPRTKEFLLGHPFMLLGIFLALRYRWATVLLVAGTIGQLSMVDTFAHIHTPLILSISRILLGLGLGLLIGFVLIAIYQAADKLRKRGMPA